MKNHLEGTCKGKTNISPQVAIQWSFAIHAGAEEYSATAEAMPEGVPVCDTTMRIVSSAVVSSHGVSFTAAAAMLKKGAPMVEAMVLLGGLGSADTIARDVLKSPSTFSRNSLRLICGRKCC